MPLPDPLPTDPDALDALYQQLIDGGDYSPEDFDRLLEARLRAWGIDPQTMTAEQLIGAMQESMNRMLMNLHLAMDSAPDGESAARLTEVIDMAQQLRADIEKALNAAHEEGSDGH
ncbi:MAG TPA: hypothetical protein VIK33_01310 [Anaerolineae bacterium]